jgi:hypothetical protein
VVTRDPPNIVIADYKHDGKSRLAFNFKRTVVIQRIENVRQKKAVKMGFFLSLDKMYLTCPLRLHSRISSVQNRCSKSVTRIGQASSKFKYQTHINTIRLG